jgi:hypothetical protein
MLLFVKKKAALAPVTIWVNARLAIEGHFLLSGNMLKFDLHDNINK